MGDKITKSPHIRFAGFTEAWEQRKVGDLGNIITGSTPPTNDQTNYGGEYLFVSPADIQSGRYVENTITTLSEKGFHMSRILKEGSVLFVSIGSTIGKVAQTKGLSTTNQQINAIEVNDVLDKDFIFTLMENKSKVIKRLAATQAVPIVNKTSFSDVDIYIPENSKEQAQIGELFKQLDNLITLHQRKLELLKVTKKSMLQKMFPKEGESVPEIRFAGFTDAWEQRKVGEFLTESKIKGSDGSIAKKLTVKLWRKGIVPKEEIYQGSSATQYYVRKSGQFMYGKLDFLNQAFGIVPPELDGYESTLDSPAFDFQDGINSRFFLEYISLKRFYKYQGNTANGSRKAKRIHAETFFEMPIPVPNYDEQQRIGLFFEQLDTTITLHQRELDLLKDFKKSMLQQMFI